jgi:hypothetical protein
MFGLDTIKRLIWGDLEKDIVRAWATKQILAEKEHSEFIKKCGETPSFSRCVIDNGTYNRIKYKKEELPKEKSQKQKAQLKSYAEAVATPPPPPPSPKIPVRNYSLRSKMANDNKSIDL